MVPAAPVVSIVVLAAVLGLAIGSFLNVVIHRVPAGLSIVSPASACPRCGSAIRPFDNVPVVSWIVLRGRCRDCSSPISARYPLVELATGILLAVVAAWTCARGAGAAPGARSTIAFVLELVAFLFLMAVSIALAAIDLETHRLPNRLVLPASVVVVLVLSGAGAVNGDWWSLARGAIGFVALGSFYLALAVAVPGGMGFGDVKLAGVLGFALAYLGWGPLVVGASAAFVLGGSFAIVLVAIGRAGRGSGIPFGPWMLCGAWVGVFAGFPIANAYLDIVGLA